MIGQLSHESKRRVNVFVLGSVSTTSMSWSQASVAAFEPVDAFEQMHSIFSCVLWLMLHCMLPALCYAHQGDSRFIRYELNDRFPSHPSMSSFNNFPDLYLGYITRAARQVGGPGVSDGLGATSCGRSCGAQSTGGAEQAERSPGTSSACAVRTYLLRLGRTSHPPF